VLGFPAAERAGPWWLGAEAALPGPCSISGMARKSLSRGRDCARPVSRKAGCHSLVTLQGTSAPVRVLRQDPPARRLSPVA
jgi:hypothetical protein